MYNPEELKLEQGNNVRRGRHPRAGHPARAVRAGQGAHAVDGAVLRHLRDRRGRAHPHRPDRRAARQAARRPRPRRCCCSRSAGSSSAACSSTPASGSRCSCRDGTPVRSTLSVRLQEYVRSTSRSAQGLFFGSPTVSAAVNAASLARAARRPGLGRPSTCTVRGRHAQRAGRRPTSAIRRCWREIAEANGIDDPLALPTGVSLVIPAAPGTAPVTDTADRAAFAPRFEVRLSGLTHGRRPGGPGAEPDGRDRPGPGRLVHAHPAQRRQQAARLGAARPGQDRRDPPRVRQRPDPAFLGEIASIEPSFPQRRAADDHRVRLRQVVQAAARPARAHRVHLRSTTASSRRDRGRERADPGGRPDTACLPREGHPGRERHGVPQGAGRAVLLRRLRRVGPPALPVPAAADRGARAGVGPQPVELRTAHLRRRAGRACRWSAGTTRSSPSRSTRTALASGLRPRQPGGAARQHRRSTCSRSLVRKGIRHESIDNPLEAAVLAKSAARRPARGDVRGAGSCIGIPDLAAGNYVAIRGRRPALQRHLPGAQGDPPARRQRVPHRLLDHASAATPA